jgi:transcriptional regulator with XRE-family HTH domain
MVIADRLRALREEKKLSQGDIEKRTGLLRCYISRVENGHTVPAIETLEKLARAMEIPMYQLFYDGEEPPKLSRSGSPQTISPGAVAAKMHAISVSFGVYWPKRKKGIANCSCTWLRKWLEQNLVE